MNLPMSKSRRAGGLVFLSGELPFLPGMRVPPGIAEQTALTLERISTTLAECGLTLSDVVQVTVHLTRPEHFTEFNRSYQQHMPEPYPVRTTVIAALVVPEAAIEITVVAAERDAGR